MVSKVAELHFPPLSPLFPPQTKRVADRRPDDINKLSVEYDSVKQTLSWFVDK